MNRRKYLAATLILGLVCLSVYMSYTIARINSSKHYPIQLNGSYYIWIEEKPTLLNNSSANGRDYNWVNAVNADNTTTR
jgi:hypothetical protein